MTRDLTTEQFGEVFDRFTSSSTSTSVFRWETLQAYDVAADEPSLVAFRQGTARPERSVRTSPWLAQIAASTIAGKDWSRVRRVVHPLSEYLRWELVAYIESQTAGERILIQVGEHTVTYPDFWLFDGAASTDRCAIVMHYTDDGVPERYELIDEENGEQLTRLYTLRDALLADAVALNEYLAAHEAIGAA